MLFSSTSTQTQTRTQTLSIDASNSSRGASLTEYALVLALVVVAMIGGVEFLTSAGGQMLGDVSDDISTPRAYENVVIETPLTPPPAWVSTTVAPTILTWVDRPVATTEGCIVVTGADLGIAASCTPPGATLLNGLSSDGEILTLSLVDDSRCLTADNSGPSPVVSMQPCGATGQAWRETSSSGDTASYQHEESGLCLQTVVPAAPNPLSLAACDGSSGQTIEVQF